MTDRFDTGAPGADRFDTDDEFGPQFGPHAGRRAASGANPYTVEGYLNGMADFAAASRSATGWQRRTAVIVAWAVLIPLGLTVLVGVVRLFSLLVPSMP